MDADLFALPLGDGRQVDVVVAGLDDGTPFVLHHGTPGARAERVPITGVAHAIRLAVTSGGGSNRRISHFLPDTSGSGDARFCCGRTIARVAVHSRGGEMDPV